MPNKRKTVKHASSSSSTREALTEQPASSLNTAISASHASILPSTQSAETVLQPKRDGPAAAEGGKARQARVGYSVVELQAMLDTFELDATSKLQALRRNQMLRLDAMRRHWQASTTAIDPRLHLMTMREFVSNYAADHDAALRSIVSATVQLQQHAATTVSQVEQSARKRKRIDHRSPLPGSNSDNAVGSSKRSKGPSAATEAKKTSRQPTVKSPAVTKQSARQARLRLRSEARTDPAGATGSGAGGNQSGFSAQLPATPSIGCKSTARRPRRGESIVIQSINGSPLGEFVASDVDSNELDSEHDKSDREQRDDQDEWDMMDKHEASQAEDIRRPRSGLSKARNVIKKNPTASTKAAQSESKADGGAQSHPKTSGGSMPAADGFQFRVMLPSAAPSYEELKLKVIADMRADLAKKVMSQEQRAHLLESLEAFIKAG
ncbi:hypothetical protein ACM66B_006707 [Microbotryomycetes sp. NB124-2]